MPGYKLFVANMATTGLLGNRKSNEKRRGESHTLVWDESAELFKRVEDDLSIPTVSNAGTASPPTTNVRCGQICLEFYARREA